jgi:hypothetical protein
MIFVYVWSTWGRVELKRRLETWITRNDVNGISLFHLSYLITLMAYPCSQRTPNVQIKYFVFHCSIYRLFVLNTGRKPDSLQMLIFVYVCSTWSVFEIKTRFETWITWNDVNVVSLCHLPYIITRMACLRSQRTPNGQTICFMFDWSVYILFVINMVWIRYSLQMFIWVNVCSTWSMVQLNTRFETSITRNDVYGVSLFHHSI